MTPYLPSFVALAAAGLLLVFLLGVADVAAIRAKHKAGTPIPPDFSRFYFRAARAHANMNESIAAFIALAVASILVAASPSWVNGLCWAYIACRLAHAAAYYANNKLFRSSAFGISMLVLLALATVFLSTVASGA